VVLLDSARPILCAFVLAAFSVTTASAESITITDATVTDGRLIITGTAPAGATITLDETFQVSATETGAFSFELSDYLPGDCIVDLTAGSESVQALVANCGRSSPGAQIAVLGFHVVTTTCDAKGGWKPDESGKVFCIASCGSNEEAIGEGAIVLFDLAGKQTIQTAAARKSSADAAPRPNDRFYVYTADGDYGAGGSANFSLAQAALICRPLTRGTTWAGDLEQPETGSIPKKGRLMSACSGPKFPCPASWLREYVSARWT